MSQSIQLQWTPPLLAEDSNGRLVPRDSALRFQVPMQDAWRVLDLQSCVSDLDTVVAIAKTMERTATSESFDFDLFEALVIAYGRGFGSGRSFGQGKSRENLRQFEASLNDEQKIAHAELLSIRNQQVAHTVESGHAVLVALFTQDGVFDDFESTSSGIPVSMRMVRQAVDLAQTFRRMALDERQSELDNLRARWCSLVLRPESISTAIEATEQFVHNANKSQDG